MIIPTQWFTTSIGSSRPLLGRLFSLLSVCLCVCPKRRPRPASPILPLLTRILAGITVIAQGCLIQSDREFDLKGQGQRPYACRSEHCARVSFANFASTEPNFFYTATIKLHGRDGQLRFSKWPIVWPLRPFIENYDAIILLMQ